MRLRIVAGLSLIVAALTCAPSAPSAAQSGAVFREDADFLHLENDQVRFTFSKGSHGGLYTIVDRDTGIDFRADKSLPAALFNLTAVRPDGRTEDIGNLGEGRFSYRSERLSGGLRLTLSYEGLAGHSLAVVVTITLPDGSPRAEWRIRIQNDDPSLVLSNVAFPLIFGLSSIGDQGDDDALVFPQLDGMLVHDPRSAIGAGEGLFATYPADLSLQMMAVYDDETGLYLAAHDARGHPKTFAYAPLPWEGKTVTLLTIHHALPEEGGHDFAPDYAAILGPFGGDWYDAAMLYKAWAVRQPWTPSPLADRSDVPAWWLAASPIVSSVSTTDDGRAVLPAERMPAWARDYAAYLGQPVTLLTFGWEKHGAWTGPDYFPPRDGEAAFRAATEALHAEGNHKFVYVSGTVWRVSRKELPDYDDSARFAAVGRPYAALERDGTPRFDPFYASIGWRAARMCPATAFWQETVVSSVSEAAKLGVDAVSVDEFPIGSIYPCYADDHDHAPGSGPWQGAAYRTILERARQEGRSANPSLVLTSEEPSEFYLSLLDGYVSRDNRPDAFLYAPHLRRFGDRLDLVPLFSAVYHEYTFTLAEPVPVHQAGFDLERLRTSLVRGIASGLVRGKIPSADVTTINEADDQLLDLFRRAAQATSGYAYDYAILGRMLRPPEIAVPRVTLDWMDVDLTTGSTQTRQMTSAAVLASTWQSPSGHVGYLLSNVTAQSQQFDLPLKAEGLSGPYLVYAVHDGAYEVLFEGDSAPQAVEIALPPRGVALVAVVAAGSEEANAARSSSRATPEPPSESTPSPASKPTPICGAALLPFAAAGFLWRDLRQTVEYG
jgi:hypothetical protein